jgi:heme A synthase
MTLDPGEARAAEEAGRTPATCPHCGTANPPGAAFCASCGKAVPPAVTSRPRVVSHASAELAGTGVGQVVQAEQLRKQANRAATALLWVAILQAVFGAIVVASLPADLDSSERSIVMVMVFGVAAIFLALYVWARKQPLPAAILGLVLFVTLHAVAALEDPKELPRGLLVKVFVIVILARAIQAGVKYRQLQKQVRT